VIDLLHSSVLLADAVASNTALLAVPDVDTSFVVDRNPVQILSYFSIVTSIGSIVVGLLLMRLVTTSRSHWFFLTGLWQALSLSGKETHVMKQRDANMNQVTRHRRRGRRILELERCNSRSGETCHHVVPAIVRLRIAAAHSSH
jgi:hypothetical protein